MLGTNTLFLQVIDFVEFTFRPSSNPASGSKMFFGNAVSLHPLDHQISLARQFRRSSFHRPRGQLAHLRECWRRGRPRINIQVGPRNGADQRRLTKGTHTLTVRSYVTGGTGRLDDIAVTVWR